MKKIFLSSLLFAAMTTSAHAYEGSWFAAGPSYENLASGGTESGFGLAMEGGYWYLGNVAYGGYFKSNFFGEYQGRGGSNLKIYDLGVFLKAGTEAGLYGKLLMGLAFVNANNAVGFGVGDGTSFSFGLGGGFLFPVTDRLQIGPEVIYRHLTAGNGGDQVSIGGLVAYSF
ncbi:MAG TPA: hypothetical protein VIH99_01250 [Bdellovibrionota bacterium]|jgi:hypothetical protein